MELNQVYKNNELQLEVREDHDQISLFWAGESTERDPGKFLMPIFNEVMSVNEHKNKKLIMDFRKLSYMNSSTVSPIIKLIDKIKQGRSELLIVYQKDLAWQELSFSALFIFTTKDRRIDIQGV